MIGTESERAMSPFCATAITAHARWKDDLRRAIDRGELPAPGIVAADDKCELGKWIYGEGRLHEKLVEYQRLKSLHAEFHRIAATIVEQVLGGDRDGALTDIRFGHFALATAKVINAIARLQKRTACSHAAACA